MDSAYDTPKKKRIYKAKMALRKMGSSVFHGGFSTFLAIFVLAPGKTYIFLSMFRLWFGIILFGMSNGFILLPVMLSFVGPNFHHEEISLSLADTSARTFLKSTLMAIATFKKAARNQRFVWLYSSFSLRANLMSPFSHVRILAGEFLTRAIFPPL